MRSINKTLIWFKLFMFFFFASFCSICDLVIWCCFTGITDAIRLNREWRLHFERKTEAQNQRQKDQSNEMYTLNTFRTWYNPCTVYKSIQFYTATIKFILILLKRSLGFFSIRCFGFGFRGFCSISIHFQCGIFIPAFIFSLTYNEPNHLSWMICVNRIQVSHWLLCLMPMMMLVDHVRGYRMWMNRATPFKSYRKCSRWKHIPSFTSEELNVTHVINWSHFKDSHFFQNLMWIKMPTPTKIRYTKEILIQF